MHLVQYCQCMHCVVDMAANLDTYKVAYLSKIQSRLASACIHRAPPLHPANHVSCKITPSGAEALRETGGRWVPRHGPAGRPAAERVWSEGLAAVKPPPPSALSLGALCIGTRRQQTQGTGPWAREAELHCTEPELRFGAVPALGLTYQAPEHPGSVAKSFGPRPQLQDMQATDMQERGSSCCARMRSVALPPTPRCSPPPALCLRPLHSHLNTSAPLSPSPLRPPSSPPISASSSCLLAAAST